MFGQGTGKEGSEAEFQSGQDSEERIKVQQPSPLGTG